MVRKAASAGISSQKGKQGTNKNKKRNYDQNKKKAPLKLKSKMQRTKV